MKVKEGKEYVISNINNIGFILENDFKDFVFIQGIPEDIEIEDKLKLLDIFFNGNMIFKNIRNKRYVKISGDLIK